MNFWPSAIGLRRMDDSPRPVRSLVARMPGFVRDAAWFQSPLLRSAGVRFALIYAALLALSALALGDTARAWQVYEQQVQPGAAWGPPLNVCTDAPAFLWRAELAGQQRNAAHWQRLRDYTDKSFPKSGVGFVDVHRALTRAAVGGDTAALVAELEQIAPRSPMGTVVPRLAKGFAAYEAGDWKEAIAVLQPVLAETVRIGGSRAQRDLVVGTLIAAYLRSGKADQARQLVQSQADRQPNLTVYGLN